MSTRCTIAYDDDFHLYQECFENDNVYLRLDKGDWSASLETETIDWRDGDTKHPTAHLRINVTLWRKIVEGWLKSEWAMNQEQDHKKLEFDPDEFSQWLESMAFNKNKKSNEVKNDEDPGT